MVEDLFSESKWKDKYPVSWCDMCHTAIITCPECKLGSCSAGSCDKCFDDYTEFLSGKVKTQIEDYLTDEELKICRKIFRIRKFILEGLRNNQPEIDFKGLHRNSMMSQRDEELFQKELQL